MAIALALAVPASVDAQERSGIGLAMMLGEPTGISAISWLGAGNAIDLVVEVAPRMTLLPGTDPFVSGGVGFRFYF